MENSLIVAVFALVVALCTFFEAAAALLWMRWFSKWIKEELKATPEPQTAQEPAYKSQEYMRQLGMRSQAVQAEKKEMEKAAYQEATAAIKAGGNDLEAIKASLSGIITKYPQVAESTTKKVIRDLGFQRYEGIIMPMVSELAARALAPKPKTEEGPADTSNNPYVWQP